jgi:2-(1,2-epoxy-1,2-dihydrophenyl)acetyl-CoA isomerase
MSADPLIFERKDAVVRLTLNRPDAANGIDIPLARALMHAAIECDDDDGVRCVVLTGAGQLFCGGGDIGGFASAGERLPVLLKELTAYLHVAISRLARMQKPLITAINGAAAGAGLSLALLGDLAIAARSAKFALAYGGIGLSPDGGATWLLPRLIGLRGAQELALTNKRLSADEAATAGLITRVVDDSALRDHVDELAAQLSNAATRAIGRTRNLLMSSFANSLEEQMELESRSIAEASRGPEGREGIAAFLAKRKPNFT